MTKQLARAVLAALSPLMLVGCVSGSEGVPPLKTPQATAADTSPGADTAEPALEDEAKTMAFTQCMRDEGIALVDSGVDAEGNVERPALAEGAQVTEEELEAAMKVCGKHLEGMSRGRRQEDVSARVDELVELATCLREKGYDVEDPTVETLEIWQKDFRTEFDWDESEAVAHYKECSQNIETGE